MSTLETVCMANTPGITEGDAVALAAKRLRIRGISPRMGIRPRVELLDLNDAVKFWQVSFLVER